MRVGRCDVCGLGPDRCVCHLPPSWGEHRADVVDAAGLIAVALGSAVLAFGCLQAIAFAGAM